MRYAYLGRKQGKHNGILCFGYDTPEGKQAIVYSMSFCSPKDNFSKKRAHMILGGRMRKGKYRILNRNTDLKHGKGIIGAMIEDYKQNKPVGQFGVQLPGWARKLKLAA